MSESIAKSLAGVPLRNLKARLDAGEAARQKVSRESQQRMCAWCEAPIAGRGERFCSLSCRTRRQHFDRQQQGLRGLAWKGGQTADRFKRYSTRAYKNNRSQVRAQKAAQKAVKNGRLIRPSSCSQCVRPCKPEAHHDDYSKPLEVRWLCRGCHVAHHRAQRSA